MARHDGALLEGIGVLAQPKGIEPMSNIAHTQDLTSTGPSVRGRIVKSTGSNGFE